MARFSSTPLAARPPRCKSADWSRAATPDTTGAAMLVPAEISSPVCHGGTLENATPGAHTSGLASSPPRALHHPTTSGGGGSASSGALAKTPGNSAQVVNASSADPGNPTVDNPGPSFPALMTNSTPGFLSTN